MLNHAATVKRLKSAGCFWSYVHGHGSTHTANKTLAVQIQAEARIDAVAGRGHVNPGPSPRLSVHVEEYLEWTEARNSTSAKDPPVLARFLAAVGDRRLEGVTTFDVDKWKTLRARQVKKATVNRELNIVRGCFSRAVEWGRLNKSPVTEVKPFRIDNTRRRVLSSDEIGGWTSLRMLERYTHPTDAEKLRAVESATRLTRVGTKTGTAECLPCRP